MAHVVTFPAYLRGACSIGLCRKRTASPFNVDGRKTVAVYTQRRRRRFNEVRIDPVPSCYEEEYGSLDQLHWATAFCIHAQHIFSRFCFEVQRLV